MAQTIQIKRFNASGETPASRGTQLAWGEMAINEAENALWYGLQAGGEALLSRDVLVEPPTPADPSAPGALWFDTTGSVLNVWTGTAWEPAADVSAGATTLGALTDVTITSASSGQVLRYNGSEWINAQLAYSDLSGTPTNVSSFTNDSGYLTSIGPLDDHTDVVLTSPANGEVLKYNGSNWINGVDGGGGGGAEELNDLNDVSVTAEGYSGNTILVNSTPGASGQVQIASNFISFHNDQQPDMALYQIGDQLTFNYDDGTTSGPWTTNTNALPNDANSYYISFNTTGVNNPIGTLGEGMTITSNPERFPGASSGDVLTYDGSQWSSAPAGGGGGAEALNDLTDVTLTSPTNGQVLKYDGSNWINDAEGGGGATYAIDESTRTADGDWLTFSTSGGVDRMQFKTNGFAGNNPTWRGDNANYGGYQFTMMSSSNQQIIFEDAGNGVNLIGYHAETGGEEGLNIIGKGFSATGSTIRLITNNKTALQTTDGSIEMANLPTSDPGNTNEVWADNGRLVLSGFTAFSAMSSEEIPIYKQIDFEGALSGTPQSKRVYAPRDLSSIMVTGYVSTSSTGPDVGYNVRVDNMVVGTGSVAAGFLVGNEVTYNAAITKGSYITIDVTQAGSGAEDLALVVTLL